MIIRRPADEILCELRTRLARGEVKACIEWTRRLAQCRDDPEMLRGLVEVLADHIESPPKLPRGARKKKPPKPQVSIDSEGRAAISIDLMAMPLLTRSEQRQAMLRLARDFAIYDQVLTLEERHPRTLDRVAAFGRVAREMGLSYEEVRDAFYRISRDSG